MGEKTLYFKWVLVSRLLFAVLICAYGFYISMISVLVLITVFKVVLYVTGFLRILI